MNGFEVNLRTKTPREGGRQWVKGRVKRERDGESRNDSLL